MIGNEDLTRTLPMPGATPTPQERERSARLHALMDRAVALYDARRYREALALADEVARLDPSAVLPDVLRYECRRALLKRRARRAAVLVAALVVLLGGVFVYRQLARIRHEPSEMTLDLAESQELRFRFTSALGRHKTLEFTWALLDARGLPAPDHEQGSLTHGHNAPWTCTYVPIPGVVRGSSEGQPVTRRIVGIGADPRGGQVVRAEWIVRVADVPMPPEIVATDPPPQHRIAVLPGGERTFRVEAIDGDGGDELTYEWLAGDHASVGGTGQAWTYRRDGEPGQGPRLEPTRDKEVVVCRVSNRHGQPLTQAVSWVVERVQSNEPPKIVGIEPRFPDTIHFDEPRPIHIAVSVHDRDRDEQIHYRWILDGAVFAVTPNCKLPPPHDPPGSPKPHRLRLIVSDICGASDERTGTVVGSE